MIKIRKNEIGAPYTGELCIGTLTFSATGDSPNLIAESIRIQVEDTYRTLTYKLYDETPGGLLADTPEKREAELNIMKLRVFYAPPHPIRTKKDAMHYHRCDKGDTLTCQYCFCWFTIEEAVYCDDQQWLGCPECKTPVEYWRKL